MCLPNQHSGVYIDHGATKTVLENFKGEVAFQILGDSLIVLNQIKRNSYNFATFAASRIQEIKENTADYKISWHHVASANNVNDILTRQYSMQPSKLPWAGHSMVISEKCLQTNNIPVPSLPDSDKKNILANVAAVQSLQPSKPRVDMTTLMLYSELRRKSCTGYTEHKANELIQGILKRNSN